MNTPTLYPIIGYNFEYQDCFIRDNNLLFNNNQFKIEQLQDISSFSVFDNSTNTSLQGKLIDNIVKLYSFSNYIPLNNLKYSDDSKILEDIQKYSFVLTMDVARYNVYTKVKQTYTNLSFNPYYGKTGKTSVISCKQNHIDMIQRAKDLNFPFVLIFEDDAVGNLNFEKDILNVFKNIPDDAAMIHLGEHQFSNGIPFEFYKNDYFHMHKSKNVWGTHAYIVFKNYYDIVLDYFNQVDEADSIFNVDNLRNIIYIVNNPIFVQFYCDKHEHIHKKHVKRGVNYIHYGKSNAFEYRDTINGFPDLRNIKV